MNSETANVPLAEVASGHEGLEWLELYSVSKSFNDPGARLGALVGTKDFVEDFVLVKGNTDSGPVPSVMAAYGEFLSKRDESKAALGEIRSLYERRLAYVVPKLTAAGLRPACQADAGFFTLWQVPTSVFGRTLPAQGRAEAFNRAVALKTGIVGVHFTGADAAMSPQPLIRYAVCADVLNAAFQKRFEEGLAILAPRY